MVSFEDHNVSYATPIQTQPTILSITGVHRREATVDLLLFCFVSFQQDQVLLMVVNY